MGVAGPWKQLGVLWKQAHLAWKPGSATCRQSDRGRGLSPSEAQGPLLGKGARISACRTLRNQVKEPVSNGLWCLIVGSEPLGELGSRTGETLCLGPFAQFEADDLALDKKNVPLAFFIFANHKAPKKQQMKAVVCLCVVSHQTQC